MEKINAYDTRRMHLTIALGLIGVIVSWIFFMKSTFTYGFKG